jgi:hypothetical protein
VPHFFLDLAGQDDRVGDFVAQQFMIPLPQPMQGHPRRAGLKSSVSLIP